MFPGAVWPTGGEIIRNNPQIDGMLERGGFLVNIQVMEEILNTISDI